MDMGNIFSDPEIDLRSLLGSVEKLMPTFLNNKPDGTLLVDYHPPVVERIWWQAGLYRIMLHRIHTCKKEEALFHKHPWPSIVKIIEGSYEMDVSYGERDTPPPIACTLTLSAGDVYTMTDQHGWHSVRPTRGSSLSLMIIGPPWKQIRSEKAEKKNLKSLSGSQIKHLLSRFRAEYLPQP